MSEELIKANHDLPEINQEYGIEQSSVTEIEQSFNVVSCELEALQLVYEELINSEITMELASRAKKFYTSLKSANGSNNNIHKSQKAYINAVGKVADTIRNKNRDIIDVMKEKTLEIVNFYENQEKERIEKLSKTRAEEIKPFLPEDSPEPVDLGYMTDDIWDNYLLGAKASQQKRADEAKRLEDERIAAEKKAEEERLEKERIDKLKDERYTILRPYYQFVPANHPDFELLTESEWNDFFLEMQDAKKEHAKKQSEMKAENERLRKEAELKAKKEAERNEQLRPYIQFIRDYSKMLNLSDEEYKKEFTLVKKGAEYHWEYERKERIRKKEEEEKRIEAERIAEAKNEKARLAHLAELKKEKDEAAKLKAELKDKEKAEKEEKERLAKIEADKKESERLAVLAPEKEKIQTWIDSISIPEFDLTNISKEGNAVINVINVKFEAFKKWAESQKESIK